MHRTSPILLATLLGLSFQAHAGETPTQQRKAEIIRKADALLGKRYRPPSGQPLRLFDEWTEWGPPDAALYWYGSSYVVELVFATDGALARVELFPEALLHSDSWTDVPGDLELLPSQKQWLVDTADQLQPVGRALSVHVPPNMCSQSGPNLYCGDTYELASVSHYWREEVDESHRVVGTFLKEVTVGYKQSISGVITDLKALGDQGREVKIGGVWYRILTSPDQPRFEQVAVGSQVRLTSVGCAGNEKICNASLAETEAPSH